MFTNQFLMNITERDKELKYLTEILRKGIQINLLICIITKLSVTSDFTTTKFSNIELIIKQQIAINKLLHLSKIR